MIGRWLGASAPGPAPGRLPSGRSTDQASRPIAGWWAGGEVRAGLPGAEVDRPGQVTPTSRRDGVVEPGLEAEVVDRAADRAFEPVGDLAAGERLGQADVGPGAGQGGVEGRAGGRGRRSRGRRGRASSRSASRAGPRRPEVVPEPNRRPGRSAGAPCGCSGPAGRAGRGCRRASPGRGSSAGPGRSRGRAGSGSGPSRAWPGWRRPAPVRSLGGEPAVGRPGSVDQRATAAFGSPATTLWRRIASAVARDPRVGRRQQAERDDQAEHADVQRRRAVDEQLGLVGPEPAEGREPPGVEEPARLAGRPCPGRGGPSAAARRRMPVSQIRSASSDQRRGLLGAVEQPRPAGRADRRPATTQAFE